MCPDFETLSAFFDNEIEAPHDRQIEEHIRSCAACQAKLEEYKQLSEMMAGDPEPDFAAGMEAVRLSAHSLSRIKKVKTVPFWQRRINIPVPALGLAALFVVFLGVVSVLNLTRTADASFAMKTRPDSSIYTEDKIPVEDQDLEKIMKALEGQDLNREVIFHIPDESKTFNFGEPALIKASDRKR
ncbi:MAG: zf-HC2 domain-containing protein [Spirochaetales bacterium]|nr:zf-HC2 domain-containing protein [Spirochaetales bacterium]